MKKRAGMAIAIAAVTAGFAAGPVAAGAAEPTTCDQVTTVLVSDQAAATADAKLVAKRTAAVTKAKAAAKKVKAAKKSASKKAKQAAKARKKRAAKRVTTAQKALQRAQAKQAADATTLMTHQEKSAALCTPGY